MKTRLEKCCRQKVEAYCVFVSEVSQRQKKEADLRITTQEELLDLLVSSDTSRASSENGRRSRRAGRRAHSWAARWERECAMTGLDAAELEFGRTELASSCSLLFKHLLLMRVGVSDLNDVLFSTVFGNRSVVELLDDIFTDIARLEAVTN